MQVKWFADKIERASMPRRRLTGQDLPDAVITRSHKLPHEQRRRRLSASPPNPARNFTKSFPLSRFPPFGGGGARAYTLGLRGEARKQEGQGTPVLSKFKVPVCRFRAARCWHACDDPSGFRFCACCAACRCLCPPSDKFDKPAGCVTFVTYPAPCPHCLGRFAQEGGWQVCL